MKKNKMYPFIILTVLIMSFVLTYYNRGNTKNIAFADTENTVASNAVTPFKELKYDIDRSSVEHETKIVYNDQKYVDYKEVVQEGSDGMKKSVYQESYVDGKLISKSLEEEIVYIEPVEEIIEVGTKEYVVATSRGGFRFDQELDMVASAYDLSYESCGKYPDHPEYGITASGTKAQPGTVAVDPSVIPLGTKLYIASTDGSPDYGFATALDTGGAINGYRIDLFMENGTDAQNYGIRQVKVYILE
ncbi:MAG: 3D domain-containing protein [Sedimentibacter saalensis]|uniref:3D domain-containing protein n=1 Tax=Sedimentibacter saalensis TaxID=130788 RepID=UPI002B1F9CA5|nr:3D domain-containing protein [Sedimentibacter saalensis]MEA5094206.1 3D domain-containing protein [Sedimentibacter saalensis]